MTKFEGEWITNKTAGGCTNYPDTYGTNPMVRISVKDPDEDDDDTLCTVRVQLIQKHRR